MNRQEQERQERESIRRHAEEWVRAAGFGTPKPESEAQLLRLLHELQVHRVELELQNEELRRARAEVEAGLVRYTDLYDFAPVAYFTLTRNAFITQSNLAGAALFGMPRASCAGRPFVSLLAPAAQAAFQSFFASALGSPHQQACDLEFVRLDQSRFHAHVVTRVEAGGLHCRLTVTDISERVRAQAEIARRLAEVSALKTDLEAAQLRMLETQKMAAVGLLAAGVAHEINPPLAFVRASLGTLGEYLGTLLACCDAGACRFSSPAQAIVQAGQAPRLRQQEDYLQFVRDDARKLLSESLAGLERMRDLVVALRDFARPDDDGWQWADLHAGFESTLRIVSSQIGSHAEIVRAFGDLPQIWCQPAQISQVFLNLLLNAAQSMTAHGIITLRSGSVDDRIWFAVEDSGCGIAEQDRERIFDPFFTTRPDGRGLGLALAYAVLARHLGTIDVRSQVGVGTVVRVTLPIQPPGAGTARPGAAVGANEPGNCSCPADVAD